MPPMPPAKNRLTPLMSRTSSTLSQYLAKARFYQERHNKIGDGCKNADGRLVGVELDCRFGKYLGNRQPIPCPKRKDSSFGVDTCDSVPDRSDAVQAGSHCDRCAPKFRRTYYQEYLETIERRCTCS